MKASVETQWNIPDGAVLLVAHVETAPNGQKHTVGYGYVKWLSGKAESLHGPITLDHMIIGFGLGGTL